MSEERTAFDELYSAYPNKDGREKAWEAFIEARKKSGFAKLDMVKTAKSFASTRAIDERIPQLHRWLKDGRYYDTFENNESVEPKEPKPIIPDISENLDNTEIASKWSVVKNNLKLQLPEGTFTAWIAPLKLTDYENGVVTLRAPNNFIKDYIKNIYMSQIEAQFKQIVPMIECVTIGIIQQGKEAA